METLQDRDKKLEDLWQQLGDVPINPKTEHIEEPFLHFPAGTDREDIWHWFDERHSKGVAYLMYHKADRVAELTPEELRRAYEKQQHIYDISDIEDELNSSAEDYVEYGIADKPVTDMEKDWMADVLRQKLDADADALWSVCREEAVKEVLKEREENGCE